MSRTVGYQGTHRDFAKEKPSDRLPGGGKGEMAEIENAGFDDAASQTLSEKRLGAIFA